MSDVVLESIRTLVLLGLVVFLWQAGKSRFSLARQGWGAILTGFGLLLFASIIDITDNYPSLNRFVVIGDTEAEAFLEKFVGFLGGFVLLAVGLVRWVPTVQQLSDERNSLKAKVAERTGSRLSMTPTDIRSETRPCVAWAWLFPSACAIRIRRLVTGGRNSV
jgi:hypothetical protein